MDPSVTLGGKGGGVNFQKLNWLSAQDYNTKKSVGTGGDHRRRWDSIK